MELSKTEDELRAALKFYADSENYDNERTAYQEETPARILIDKGAKARYMLSKGE
jgi:hypothetical protein